MALSLAVHAGLGLVGGVRCEVRESAVLEVAPEELYGIETPAKGGQSCCPGALGLAIPRETHPAAGFDRRDLYCSGDHSSEKWGHNR